MKIYIFINFFEILEIIATIAKLLLFRKIVDYFEISKEIIKIIALFISNNLINHFLMIL